MLYKIKYNARVTLIYSFKEVDNSRYNIYLIYNKKEIEGKKGINLGKVG